MRGYRACWFRHRSETTIRISQHSLVQPNKLCNSEDTLTGTRDACTTESSARSPRPRNWRRPRPGCHTGSGSRRWSGCRRWTRSCCRSWGRGRRGSASSSSRRCYCCSSCRGGSGRGSRSRRRCRRSSRNAESVNFIVVGDIDAAASGYAAVPFTRAGHHIASSVNHSARVTVVTV